MLKMTGVFIECLSDMDMILFLEANIRGGVSYINQRHCEADEDPRDLDPAADEEGEDILERTKCIYVDGNLLFHPSFPSPHLTIFLFAANNLYGYAQSCMMPVGGFAWMEEEAFLSTDWTVFDENSETGYILEVDLLYPEHLHLDHSSLPLAPHRMTLTEKEISPFSMQCLQELKKNNAA